MAIKINPDKLPKLTIAQQLEGTFNTLPPELRADFSPLKAAVKLELDQGNTDIAKLVIQRAQIPAELEPLRKQMLEVFNV